MKFSLNNFLFAVKQIVTGSGAADATGLAGNDGGFNKDTNIALNSGALNTNTSLTTDANGVLIASLSAAHNTAGVWNFLIPRDYDEATDKLIVRILVNSAGTTDTPILTVTPITQKGSTHTALTAVNSAAISSTMTAYEFNLSSNSLTRDTVVSFTLSTGNHTTDAVQVYAIETVIASCLVSYNDTLDALNVPLR